MTEESTDTKICPFCAEAVKAAAIVCKHCGRDLPAGSFTSDDAVMLRHGIVYKDERYIWRGNYFEHLNEAVEYVKRHAPHSIVADVKLAPIATAPEKPFKWWLWLPLGAIALFLGYGASIPKYKSDANAARRLCEKSLHAPQYECDALYEKMIREGAAAQYPQSGSPDPKASDRRKVNLCWKQYQAMSFDDKHKLTQKDLCNSMENEFAETWGTGG